MRTQGYRGVIGAMPEIILSIAQRKAHRADAHHLDPVVAVGGDGLTEGVIKEADHALNAHGLIKVRVHGDDRDAREAIYAELADKLNAARIQHIGKLLVFWRPMPEKERVLDEDRKPVAVPRLHPTTADEKRRWDAALLRKALRKELAQRFEQVRTASMAAMVEAVPA